MLNQLRSTLKTFATPVRCVGTYHKTGTVWMMKVFNAIAMSEGIEFFNIERHAHGTQSPKKGPIYFQDHCDFPEELIVSPVRGIRIVRDPRDVVISGAHYHCKSSEEWLHIKREEYGNRTYSETINSCASDAEKYNFEMQNVAADTIQDMTNSKGQQRLHRFLTEQFITIRYEDLIEDVDLVEFKKICSHLRLPFKKSAPHFQKHSLFSGQAKTSNHIRSGRKQQWREKFDPETARAFAERHQHALEILGYEKDDSWIESLSPQKS